MKEEKFYCDICGDEINGNPRNSPDIKRKTDGWSKPEQETIHACLDCGHPWIEKVQQGYDFFLVEDSEVVALEKHYYDRDEMEEKRYVVFLDELNTEEDGNTAVIKDVVDMVDNMLQGRPAKQDETEEKDKLEEMEDDGGLGSVDSINEAIERIRIKTEIQNVVRTNEGRHRAIKTGEGKIYWVLYKREFFHKYSEIFDGEKGEGESINQHPLNEAIRHDVDCLLFVYEDGGMFFIEPEEVKKYAEENDTIRNTHGGEMTYSFPVSKLEEWKGDG